MGNEFDEEAEREKLTEAELQILKVVQKKNLSIFFINDRFYVFDNKTNRKILCSNADVGFNFIMGLLQEGSTAGRVVLHPADKKRIRDAMHTYIPRYVNFTFAPNQGRVVDEQGLKYYNVFQPSFYDDKPLEPPYTFPTIEKFLDRFFNTAEEKRWFLERLAYSLQNCEDRLPTAILFTGIQGSGKDTIKTIMERTVGSQNLFNLEQMSLEGQFNSFIGKSLVIFCNEVHNWKNPELILNKLKNYMTNKKITVNSKYEQPFTATNHAMWCLATNDPKFRPPTDGHDRRWTICFQYKKLDENLDKETFNNLMDLIQNPEHENEVYSEYHHFYWYLKNLKIENRDFIKNPLNTEYKEQMIRANLSHDIDWGILCEFFKNLRERGMDFWAKVVMVSETSDRKRYFIKPKDLLPEISKMRKEINVFKERKYAFNSDTFKQELIGKMWFKDHTKSPTKINGESVKCLEVIEPRLIEVIEGKNPTLDEDDS
jgi:hypothetical protein